MPALAGIRSSTVRDGHRRLESLYEITKLFASFEAVERTLDRALAIVAKTLPLHSVMLVEVEEGRCRMISWASEGQTAEHTRAAKAFVETAYASLVGAGAAKPLDPCQQLGASTLPPQPDAESPLATRLIVIPLVVAHRAPFGALAVEGGDLLDRKDLMFVNAIANQLAVALDRDTAHRHDIRRREQAESDRLTAERLRATFEALADENARLAAQARHAVQVREQILAIVSHDLRNPLGTILLTTTALLDGGGPEAALLRIQRSAELMRRFIEDLLDFASIEAGHLAVKCGPQDAGVMLSERRASFDAIAQTKQLRLTIDAAPDLPKVYGDHDRVLQALANLVGNATAATDPGGRIALSVDVRGREMVFAVSDTGPGISPDDILHLFDRYWRSSETNYKGTGLGLAIAKGIVAAHGGRMWVDSELGRGATFFFTIPLTDPNGGPPAKRRSTDLADAIDPS